MKCGLFTTASPLFTKTMDDTHKKTRLNDKRDGLLGRRVMGPTREHAPYQYITHRAVLPRCPSTATCRH